MLLNLNQQLTVFWPQMASVCTLRKEKKSSWQLCCDFDRVIDYIKDSLCLLKCQLGFLALFVQVLQCYKVDDVDQNLPLISHESQRKWSRNNTSNSHWTYLGYFLIYSNLHSKLNDFKMKYIHDAFTSLRD